MKQTVRVLNYIKDFGSITTKEAFNDLGVARLASRIHELNQMGYNITKVMEKGENRYGETTHYARYRFE